MAILIKPETEIEWATEPEWPQPKPRGPVATLLAKALSVLAQGRWTKGAFRIKTGDEESFCAIGVINFAAGHDGSRSGWEPRETKAAEFVALAAGLSHEPWGRVIGVVTWNDEADEAMVLQAFQKAIELADEQGA